VRSRTGKFRADVSWSLSIPKRILDIAVAVLVLSLSAVPMLIIALLIRLTSKGPAIFIQTRVGKKGRRFAIYKFRMYDGRHRSEQRTKSHDGRR
jgi:lipopolysaccharide/colanic/teichoic acid biosynthesis glycosyltransferase